MRRKLTCIEYLLGVGPWAYHDATAEANALITTTSGIAAKSGSMLSPVCTMILLHYDCNTINRTYNFLNTFYASGSSLGFTDHYPHHHHHHHEATTVLYLQLLCSAFIKDSCLSSLT